MWNNTPVALKMLKQASHFAEFQKEAGLLWYSMLVSINV